MSDVLPAIYQDLTMQGQDLMFLIHELTAVPSESDLLQRAETIRHISEAIITLADVTTPVSESIDAPWAPEPEEAAPQQPKELSANIDAHGRLRLDNESYNLTPYEQIVMKACLNTMLTDEDMLTVDDILVEALEGFPAKRNRAEDVEEIMYVLSKRGFLTEYIGGNNDYSYQLNLTATHTRSERYKLQHHSLYGDEIVLSELDAQILALLLNAPDGLSNEDVFDAIEELDNYMDDALQEEIVRTLRKYFTGVGLTKRERRENGNIFTLSPVIRTGLQNQSITLRK